MKKLTKEQIIMLHSELIRETGGSDGLRDEGLLDSALNAPFQGFGDVDNFPSLQQKGARLGYGLICNHSITYSVAVLISVQRSAARLQGRDIRP